MVFEETRNLPYRHFTIPPPGSIGSRNLRFLV